MACRSRLDSFGLDFIPSTALYVNVRHHPETIQIDPERISFTATLKILRCRLPEIPANQSQNALEDWYLKLVQEISEEVLPRRRNVTV